jgi:hypothetical protein
LQNNIINLQIELVQNDENLVYFLVTTHTYVTTLNKINKGYQQQPILNLICKRLMELVFSIWMIWQMKNVLLVLKPASKLTTVTL